MSFQKKAETCSGGYEAHMAHLELNGECPWCGFADEDQMLPLDGLSDVEAVKYIERRWG